MAGSLNTMTPIWEGQVKTDGKLFLDKGEKFEQYLQGLNGKRVQVTVEKIMVLTALIEARFTVLPKEAREHGD